MKWIRGKERQCSNMFVFGSKRAPTGGCPYSLSIPLLVCILTFAVPFFILADLDLPRYGQVPEFAFTERSKIEMTLADLKGKVWIADFIFTRCQGMCPLMTGRMAALQEKFSGSSVELVSFSVDPEHDTPSVLSDYADKHGAVSGKWVFLTGQKQAMWKFITDGFSLGVAEPTAEDLAAGAEPVIHSSRFVLVDQEGQIRGYFDSSEPLQMDQLVQAAKTLSAF